MAGGGGEPVPDDRRAARLHAGHLPAPPADGPGQSAFADAERVAAILDAAGWRGRRAHAAGRLARDAGRSLTGYLTRLGPLSRILPTLEPARRDHLPTWSAPRSTRTWTTSEVRFDVACWMAGATA